MSSRILAICCAVAATAFSTFVSQAGVDVALQTVTSVSGSPLYVTHAPGDETDRLYVVIRTGRIDIIEDGAVRATPFLTIPGVSTFFEGGFLGLAFHPQYETNGKFYVYYTEDSGTFRSVIAEYTRSAGDPFVADASSERRLLMLQQNAGNHNGGWIGFSPVDNFLYINFGDDANSSNGQNTSTLKGKVLRIDVNGDDFPADANRNYAIPAGNPFVGITGEDEIWAYGLRNPYRASFDRATGDLFVADVGAGSFEEVDHLPAGQGGINLGWSCREGANCRTSSCCNDPGLTDPIYDYSHSFGCSITGGNIYRGCAIPDLDGTYFFGDFCRNFVYSFEFDGANVTNPTQPATTLNIGQSVAGFGEDSFGEIYVCGFNGRISKIVSTVAPADKNNNGIPDTCEATLCLGDCDKSGAVDFNDLVSMLFVFGQDTGDACDADESGTVDFNDLVSALFVFGPCE